MDIRQIILTAGEMLKKRYFENTKSSVKERYHLLSEVDLEMNEFLTKELRNTFPGYSIHSEEADELKESGGSRWIIDPIDGTSNFITGNPYFAISVALETDGEIAEGHVYNPLSDEYFFASSESDGALLNGRRISPSITTGISDSIVAFGFSANMKIIQNYYDRWSVLFEGCRKGVCWVAPALSICNVARGKVDAFIDSGCSMWGQSAASLILRKAGGRMYDLEFAEYSHRTKGAVFVSSSFEMALRGAFSPGLS